MKSVRGVGIVGAGSAAQGIHIPTLARLRERFEVRGIVDPDRALADEVSRRTGARVYPDIAALAASAEIDVVCLCSPERFHVEQIVAASEAGARAVLCEKPLGIDVTPAREGILDAAARGTIVVVGTMHAADPVWLQAVAMLDEIGPVVGVDSSAILPLNDRFEEASAEMVLPSRGGPPSGETPGATIRRRILLSSIHDTPLLRRVLPDAENARVVDAAPLQPIGYTVLAETPSASIQLISSMRPHWDPQWRLRVIGTEGELELAFPPSFVLAGSASAVLRGRHGVRVLPSTPVSAYAAEWMQLDEMLDGVRPAPDPGALADDLSFAISLADMARDLLDGVAA